MTAQGSGTATLLPFSRRGRRKAFFAKSRGCFPAFLSRHSGATLRSAMSPVRRALPLIRIGLALASFAVADLSHGEPATSPASGIYARIPIHDEFRREQIPMFRAWNPDPVGRHAANLRALDPGLAMIVVKAQAGLPGLRFVIGSGRRTGDEQRQAVSWGWSRTRSTAHRSGRAVDLWPLDGEGRVVFDPALQDRIAAAMKQAASEAGVRIRWGGHFRGYKHKDRSHFELAVSRLK